ncbi:MATE family efflux transporter [Xanthovirga aplysinae]|uniref:MATE family efflux transporter n=1 Tax=Xanthovirga aplysinae TaxID=2529853 RepID=UPI0012BC7B3D|nr:MATE family efflux transporter [Xanthovirga aplysinae]MTI32275.1 hypothetical protein [Xanthovirga aplysinae]
MKNNIQLDKDPIIPLFFKYYLPTLTSLLSVTIHQIVDGVILGRYVGEEGVAAVGLFGGPIITFYIAFFLPLTIGGGIMISKNIGAKNPNKAQEVFQFTSSYALLIGSIILFTGPLLTKTIVYFMVGNDDASLYQSTYDYFYWGFLWLPFFLLRMILGNAVSHDGAPKVARNASLWAVIINIVLDFLLIIIIPMGTKGASIATGVAVFVSSLYLIIYLNKGKGKLSIKKFTLTFKIKEWKELLNHGLPTFVSEISFSVGLLMINKSLVPYGHMAIAAFGMVNYISFIFLRLFTAAMVSVLPIMSFNIGASLANRVFGALKFSLLFTTILGLVVTSVGFIFPELLIDIFSSKESQGFRDIAVESFGLFFLLFLVAGPNYILGAYFQTIGKPNISNILNLSKGAVLIAFFLYLLPDIFGLGLKGIWLSRSAAEVGSFLMIGLFTFSQKPKYYSKNAILK